MANMKDIGQSADKWMRRAAVAGPDYQAGVSAPRRSWQEASSAADGNYKAAVMEAANAGRYKTGVAKAGDARWREGALQKGPSRFAEGVSLSVDGWQRGFAPYAEAIKRVALPARGPAGSPQNLQRVAAISNALRGVKIGK